jgi:sporulation protein YlmC with PRC-barrel domain
MMTITIVWNSQEERRIEIPFGYEVKEIKSIILIHADLTIEDCNNSLRRDERSKL